MSKAFTKDDDGDAELLVAPRAPLPAGLPNYVTPRGLIALHAERASLEREHGVVGASDAPDRAVKLHALAQRLAALQTRIATAVLVDTPTRPHGEVRFGARVRVRNSVGKELVYRIVGIDEADAESGRIAFSSPLARALLGKREGDSAPVDTPRAHEELEVLGIDYEADAGEAR